MIKKLLFIIIFSSTSVYADKIVVVNIDKLINTNEEYSLILDNIENKQKRHLNNFLIEEQNLEKLLDQINSSKLILSDDEINNLINEYNQKLNNLTSIVDKFNIHYQEQIENIRNKILQEIIVLLENYAKNNDIELILDSTTYIIASNEIDITSKIAIDLKEINFNLEFKDFENN